MTPPSEVERRARHGADALHPFDDESRFGETTLGGTPRGPTLDRLVLAPPLFTPLRFETMRDLGREPVYADVDTACTLGGFEADLPVAVASMGSTDVANRHGPEIAEAAARAGVPMGVGENVATVRGYDEPTTDQPSLKDRTRAYLSRLDGAGGIAFQQSVEDAHGELWNRLYSDPELSDDLEAGRVGFEIKAGQGAKPGLGGAIRVGREEALDLVDRYHFPTDPREVEQGAYERHSAPGTYTADILKHQLRLMRNNYPRACLHLKVGPYRDLARILDVAADVGIDAVVVDGAEGGTAMAPTVALDELGLPTLACLARARDADLPVLVAGGLSTGADVVKALALGADGCIMGRPFIEAARVGGVDGVTNLIEALRVEIQLCTSALGKYDPADLGPEDVQALDRDLADALDVAWVMQDPHPA